MWVWKLHENSTLLYVTSYCFIKVACAHWGQSSKWRFSLLFLCGLIKMAFNEAIPYMVMSSLYYWLLWWSGIYSGFIIVTIITSFSHKIFECVLLVRYRPLFSFSASLFCCFFLCLSFIGTLIVFYYSLTLFTILIITFFPSFVRSSSFFYCFRSFVRLLVFVLLYFVSFSFVF